MSVKVSVVMSVYKDRGKLQETVQSVLAQNFSDFEFIIIDDASPDNVLEKIRQFARHDDRIRVILNEHNLGLTRSLHKGVASSKGKYIARIDEGDLWHPHKLALQVDFLERNPDYVLVGSQYLNICETIGVKTPGTRLPDDWPDVWRWLVGGKTPFIHSTILFRNSLLNYNQAATTSQDFEIYLRLSFFGKMANISEPLIDFLRQEDGISHKRQEVQFFNHLIMHKQFIEAIRTGSQESFAKSGVDFSKRPLLMRFRMEYMRTVLKLIGYENSGMTKKIVKILLLPDLLFYHLYKRYAAFWLTKSIRLSRE